MDEGGRGEPRGRAWVCLVRAPSTFSGLRSPRGGGAGEHVLVGNGVGSGRARRWEDRRPESPMGAILGRPARGAQFARLAGRELGGGAPSCYEKFVSTNPVNMRPSPSMVRSARRASGLALGLIAAVGLLLGPSIALGESIIKRPGAHPDYSVELEPHLVLGWATFEKDGFVPNDVHFDGPVGWGPGARLSIPLVDNGFLRRLNNNVALGLGLDWAHYNKSSANVLWIPVVMQWNFFMTDVITVFGEPGLAFRHASWEHDSKVAAQLVLQAGAKFMFSDRVGLTLRLGAPYFSVGVSFLL